MVSKSSQQIFSRNAVEEPRCRGDNDITKCPGCSSLHGETSIKKIHTFSPEKKPCGISSSFRRNAAKHGLGEMTGTTFTMLLVAFLCEVAHGATEDVTYAQATVDHIGGVLYVDPEDSGDDEQSDPEEIERDERRKRHVELIIKDSNREEEETLPVLILKDGSRESHETATSEMPAFNGDFCGWMRNRNVRNRRIMELTVPVSHDACTYVVKNAGKKKKKAQRNVKKFVLKHSLKPVFADSIYVLTGAMEKSKHSMESAWV